MREIIGSQNPGTDFRVSCEIELDKRKSSKDQGTKQPVIYNYCANMYSVHYGDNATANVIQIDNSQSRDVINVLKEIEAALRQQSVLPDQQKEEIIEIITDGQKEIQKDKPNITKFQSYMLTIGTTIQTFL